MLNNAACQPLLSGGGKEEEGNLGKRVPHAQRIGVPGNCRDIAELMLTAGTAGLQDLKREFL